MMTPNIVQHTKSGLITRYDEDFGLLTYSPYSGLIFATQPVDAPNVYDWLDKKKKTSPSDVFEQSLGPGWFIDINNAQYPIPHLLPSAETWPIVHNPKWPILINWFITGGCPLACKYCYAEDLMHGKCKEPNESDIERIAKAILSYKPLIVVLTGGDPLFSPNLHKAVNLLHKQVGIMVDTSAYTFTFQHLQMFKKYSIVARISFDSERPQTNNAQRPSRKTSDITSTEAAINALCQCLDAGITTSVQSVATRKTANDLSNLGYKLYRLGVRSWRVHKVAPSKDRWHGYHDLVGTPKQQKKLYEHTFMQLLSGYETRWKKKMSLQITHNVAPNAVILVSPDGIFYTESNVKPGKIIIDEKSPYRPSIKALFNKVNMHAHSERYLNLTTTSFNNKNKK